MKNRIIKSILTLALVFVALPMLSQDFMNIYFKDGTFKIFHFSNVISLTTSQIDEDGVLHSDYQYQHVTTLADEYVYPLEDIDRIEFTKYKEEVVLENITETMEDVLPKLNNCENIADAENIIEDIKQSDYVEDAWSDGHELHIKVKDWETMSFHFNHVINDESSLAKSQQAIKSIVSKIKKNSKINVRRPTIVFANQRDNNLQDTYFTSSLTNIVNVLKTEGYDAEYIPMPSLDFFYEDMYDYDVVLLITHGGYSLSNGHSFLTGYQLGKVLKNVEDFSPSEGVEEIMENRYNSIFDDAKYAKARDDIRWTWNEEIRNNNGKTETYWVAYANVYDSFFEHTAAKTFSNPNSILFNSACMSLKGGNQVADIFREKRKLGTYIGYDESNYFGPTSGAAFVLYLLSGMSAEKAKEELATIPLTPQVMGDGDVMAGGSSLSKENIIEYSNGNYVRSYTAKLNMFPEDNLKRFVTTVYTIEKGSNEVNQEYSRGQFIKVEGGAGIRTDKDININFGFEITYYDPVTNTWKLNAETVPISYTDKVEFYANLYNLQPGRTYYYRAYTYDGLNYNYGDTYSFKIEQGGGDVVAYTSCPDSHHPHLIDLGLPSGTKWACCNVGAEKPEDYGGYYAWGETTEKSSYTSDNYLDGKGTSYDIGKDIAGTQYDAATANWGSPWVMPNKEQMEELKNSCTSEWTTENGVNGRRFTGPNGASVFLPAAGSRWYGVLYGAGSRGRYWSSTLSESSTDNAWYLFFGSGDVYADYYDRYGGQSVRPVMSAGNGAEPVETETFTVNGVSFKMIPVKGGTFLMGSEFGDSDEKPVHRVTLSDYYIGETEVTQELWKSVMGTNPSQFTTLEKQPVDALKWTDCQPFIDKLNELTGCTFRLPTEAEWEYAARGGNASEGYMFSGSDNINEVAWYSKNSNRSTHVVASKASNELGLYDMSGNVWEWCQDYYGDYSSDVQVNPVGPSSGLDWVLRGGGYGSPESNCRSTNRDDDTSSSWGYGMRLALSK